MRSTYKHGMHPRRWMCPCLSSSACDNAYNVENGYNLAYPINLPAVNVDVSAGTTQTRSNAYWMGWQPDYPLDHKWPEDAGNYFNGTAWPNMNKLDNAASQFIWAREKPIERGPGSQAHDNYLSPHYDNSLTYSYADGHVESGFLIWYIWAE